MTIKTPPKRWTKREYPFHTLKVGDQMWETESLGYFRTAASRYFKNSPRKTYASWTLTRNGQKGVLVERTADRQ